MYYARSLAREEYTVVLPAPVWALSSLPSSLLPPERLAGFGSPRIEKRERRRKSEALYMY